MATIIINGSDLKITTNQDDETVQLPSPHECTGGPSYDQIKNLSIRSTRFGVVTNQRLATIGAQLAQIPCRLKKMTVQNLVVFNKFLGTLDTWAKHPTFRELDSFSLFLEHAVGEEGILDDETTIVLMNFIQSLPKLERFESNLILASVESFNVFLSGIRQCRSLRVLIVPFDFEWNPLYEPSFIKMIQHHPSLKTVMVDNGDMKIQFIMDDKWEIWDLLTILCTPRSIPRFGNVGPIALLPTDIFRRLATFINYYPVEERGGGGIDILEEEHWTDDDDDDDEDDEDYDENDYEDDDTDDDDS